MLSSGNFQRYFGQFERDHGSLDSAEPCLALNHFLLYLCMFLRASTGSLLLTSPKVILGQIIEEF